MKKRLTILFSVLLFVYGSIIFGQSNLLAPAYPGSKLSPLRTDKTQCVYLSRDPINKVRSYYGSKLGKLTSNDPLTTSYFLNNLGNTPVASFGKTLMTANQISRSEGYPDPDAKDIGVLLLEKKPPQQDEKNSSLHSLNIPSGDSLQKKLEQMQEQLLKTEGNQTVSKSSIEMYKMSDLFEGLKNEVFMQRHSQKELTAVYNKYKFLDASFFLLVKDKNDGTLNSYAKVLLKQYKSKIKKSNLMSDHWNYWLGFLKKLAAHSYKTCIVINTKPSSWKK